MAKLVIYIQNFIIFLIAWTSTEGFEGRDPGAD
jgi:hypothetical protein